MCPVRLPKMERAYRELSVLCYSSRLFEISRHEGACVCKLRRTEITTISYYVLKFSKLPVILVVKILLCAQAPDYCLQCEDPTRHYAHMRDHPSCQYYGTNYSSNKPQQNPLLRTIRPSPLEICLPRSAITFYSTATEANLPMTDDDALVAKCNQLWEALPEAQKKVYVDKSLEDKTRFEVDMLRAYSGTDDPRWTRVTASDVQKETCSVLQDCIRALCAFSKQDMLTLPPATRIELSQIHEKVEMYEKKMVGNNDSGATQTEFGSLQKRY